MEDMRREAQELLGHSLLGWLSQGNAAFKAPHWSFLVNTLSCAYADDGCVRVSRGGVGLALALAFHTHTYTLITIHPTPPNTKQQHTAIATHRTQFLPLIAGTLGGLLAARFAPEEEAGAGGGGHGCVLRLMCMLRM